VTQQQIGFVLHVQDVRLYVEPTAVAGNELAVTRNCRRMLVGGFRVTWDTVLTSGFEQKVLQLKLKLSRYIPWRRTGERSIARTHSRPRH
jgi:hypothetical protein